MVISATKYKIVLTTTIALMVLIPVFGLLIAHNPSWTGAETGILEGLSHAPHSAAAVSSFIALVFGTPATIVIGIIMVACIAWRTRSRTITLKYALMIAIPLLYAILIKYIVARPRPSFAGALGVAPHSFSFPSGHTASAVVFLSVLIYATRNSRYKWLARVVGGLVVLCVGMSRLILGVHFPTDVLGSLILCPFIVAAVALTFDRLHNRKLNTGI